MELGHSQHLHCSGHGWGVAATEVILSLILTILVVMRRRVSECVIVGSESMRVCICGCV